MDATTLVPAEELARQRRARFRGESAEYHEARRALLAEEIAFRRHMTRLVEQRQAPPLGPVIEKDYRFKDANGEDVGLIDLFGDHDTLVSYFWMYDPQRERPCPMCTAFLGALDVPSRDIAQRVAVAVIGRSPVSRQLAFARERGWRNLTFYQCIGDDFPRDYRGLSPDGDEWPALDVWIRRDGRAHHFWASELGGTEDPGQDPRGAPDPTPLWNILDLTPAGRGTDWYPKLSY